MRYGFVNNFSQALAADLAAGATTMTLDGGGSQLSAASAGLVYTLTLDDGAGTVEIVHVTAAAGNDLTITKGREGTADASWSTGATVECRLTAATASGFAWGLPSSSIDPDGVSIQPSRSNADEVASGTSAVAIGAESKAVDRWGVSIGYRAASLGDDSVTIGGLAESAVDNSTTVGAQAYVRDAGASGGAGSAFGYYANVDGSSGTAVGGYSSVVAGATQGLAAGWGATVGAAYATILGSGAEAVAGSDSGVGLGLYAYVDGEGSMALGHNAVTGAAGQLALGPNAYPGAIQSAASVTAAPVFLNTLYSPLSYQHDVAMRMSLPMLVRSDDIALGSTGDKGSVTFPASANFFIEAIDMVVVSSAGGGATPIVDVGTAPLGSDIVSGYQLTNDTLGVRVRMTSAPHGVGVSAVHFSVSTAAGTSVSVRFILHGYLMET